MSKPDLTLFPVLKGTRQLDSNEVVLELFIPEELAYLNGHFDQIAIVPGVTQIHWAVYYAQQNFNKLIDAHQLTNVLSAEQTPFDGFYEMQVIKFKSLIFPKTTINLNLRFIDDSKKLYFRFYSETQEFSSGRLYFTSA
jgi:3-hydroxymyristoyl/3-hydroxydecanoyl-(acyl carrier protein) dehydratase